MKGSTHLTKKEAENPQLFRWRKQMQRFHQLKSQLLQLLSATCWEPSQVKQWYLSPISELKNKAPRDLMNPKSIQRLYTYARTTLKPTK